MEHVRDCSKGVPGFARNEELLQSRSVLLRVPAVGALHLLELLLGALETQAGAANGAHVASCRRRRLAEVTPRPALKVLLRARAPHVHLHRHGPHSVRHTCCGVAHVSGYPLDAAIKVHQRVLEVGPLEQSQVIATVIVIRVRLEPSVLECLCRGEPELALGVQQLPDEPLRVTGRGLPAHARCLADTLEQAREDIHVPQWKVALQQLLSQ
mmetsp:Transcript_77619/g.180021  ORF Transcript_77619/g.180021 Transcript_77619/m.180021 type:complete len:211 (-) Transcript_77619:832-1464(-)